MNTSRMPGFCAEGSLNQSNARYRVASMVVGPEGEAEIAPAMTSKCGWKTASTHCCTSEDAMGKGACCCNYDLGCSCAYQSKGIWV